MKSFPLRLLFAVLMLIFSIGTIAWSFLPGARIVLKQKIQPAEMQLPSPSGYKPYDNLRVEYHSYFWSMLPDHHSEHLILLN